MEKKQGGGEEGDGKGVSGKNRGRQKKPEDEEEEEEGGGLACHHLSLGEVLSIRTRRSYDYLSKSFRRHLKNHYHSTFHYQQLSLSVLVFYFSL